MTGRSFGEGDCAAAFVSLGLCFPAKADAPAEGKYIFDILAKKQEVVGNCDQREQVLGDVTGKGENNHIVEGNAQIEQAQDPGLNRNDIEQQELCVGIECCKTDQQAQVQIYDTGRTAEDHTEYIHHEHTGQIEQIKPESTPGIFHSPPQTVVTEQTDQHNQNVAGAVGQYIGKQTPDLTAQDQFAVKSQHIVESVALIYQTENIDQGCAQRDI